MEIKILGPGCSKCKKTAQRVQEAVTESGVHAHIEKVTDLMEIAGYGVFGTPAVVVNGDLKCVGRVPSKNDVKTWIS